MKKLQIGTDVWAVSEKYRPALVRGHIKEFVHVENSEREYSFYRVEPIGRGSTLDFEENEIFPVSDRCHDALCRLDALRDKVFFSMT